MDKKKLSIAIPASVIADTPHLREKTAKIGLIGRASAIFRVDEIIVYEDNPKTNQARDLELISTLLVYLETPQYLRKQLFKLSPLLQYAGILPPLRTPHHPSSGKSKNLKVGEYREGMVLARTKEGMLVDIGVEKPALMFEKQFPLNERLTTKITRISEQVQVQSADREDVPAYWGYRVEVERKTLVQLIEDVRFDLKIGTSKLGTKFTDVAEQLTDKWKKARSIFVGFGAPARGLYEIAKDEGTNLNNITDFVLNTIPFQGTETVRTEEALLATLAILNLQFDH